MGIGEGLANSLLVKVNQIGTLTETLEAVSIRPARRLHRGDEPPLGRDRGRDDRRPRGRHQLRPDQDRLARPLGPARQVQPADPHRGRAFGDAAAYAGAGCFGRLAASISAAPCGSTSKLARAGISGDRNGYSSTGCSRALAFEMRLMAATYSRPASGLFGRTDRGRYRIGSPTTGRLTSRVMAMSAASPHWTKRAWRWRRGWPRKGPITRWRYFS